MFQLKCWKISRSFWCLLHVMVSSWSWSVPLETVGFTDTYVQNIHHTVWDKSTEPERWWLPPPPCFLFNFDDQVYVSILRLGIASPTGLPVTTSSLFYDCLLFFIFTSRTKIDNKRKWLCFASNMQKTKTKRRNECNCQEMTFNLIFPKNSKHGKINEKWMLIRHLEQNMWS